MRDQTPMFEGTFTDVDRRRPVPDRGRRPVALVSCVAVALGTVYAAVVPHGLPYDEPHHWLYVRHVAKHWSLPVLGDPGVTYEAQQGPVAYYAYAVVARLTTALGGGESAQFMTARIVGLGWLVACVVLAIRIVGKALPAAPSQFVALGVAIAYLNPMVVADASSIQNDIPSLALAMLAIHLAGSEQPRHVLVGVALGLALLTKFTVWPVTLVLGVWTLRQHGLKAAATLTAAATAVFGWWLIRNVTLYGDMTAASAVERTGVSWPPIGWDGISTVLALGRSVVTFLWLPVEYFRNTIQAPPLIEAIVVASTAAVSLGGILALRTSGDRARLLLAVAALAVPAWIAVTVVVEGASLRITYVSLTAWALLAAASVQRWGRPASVAAGLTLGLLHTWTMAALLLPRLA